MRFNELLFEKDEIPSKKREIIKRLMAIDSKISDPKQQTEIAHLLDKIYQLLNTQSTFDKFKEIVTKELEFEYGPISNSRVKKQIEMKILQIAGKIAEVPLKYEDKMAFAENLKNGKVINPNILLKPGQHTITDLCYGSTINATVFDYLKDYGVGEMMKGPGEHALALLSPQIKLVSTGGDISVKGIPVEVKASRSGGGGGRFGESSSIPSRETMLDILLSIPELKLPITNYLKKQKSINLEVFFQLLGVLRLNSTKRKQIAKKVFGTIFGNHAQPIIDAFGGSGSGINDAYAVANFDWYKASNEGGAWQLLVAINFAGNTVAVVKNGIDVLTIRRYKSTPSIITTGKPSEALYQFTPTA